MASVSHDDVEPITDRMHDNSWSANLEKPHHADDRTLVVEQAIDAIEHTVSGNHVNLVTHGDHGHPRAHLFDALGDEYGSVAAGAHVTRAHVRSMAMAPRGIDSAQRPFVLT